MGNVREAQISWVILVPHILLCFVYVGFLTIWKPILTKLTTKLSHDDKSAFGQTGVIKVKYMDCPISQISSIRVEKNLFGRIFDYGTIYIATSGDKFSFKYIKSPEEFRNSILGSIK